jgi:hypothetical protein
VLELRCVRVNLYNAKLGQYSIVVCEDLFEAKKESRLSLLIRKMLRKHLNAKDKANT